MKSQFRLAANEFKAGNYLTALEIYNRLGELLGANLVAANIALCEKRLRIGSKLSSDVFSIEESPLKSYAINPRLNKKNFNDILIDFGESFEIKQDVVPGEEYFLSLMCATKEVASPKGVVADFSFYNAEGTLISKPYQGMAQSKAFGSYFYVETQKSQSVKPKEYRFLAPDSAARVSIKLVNFSSKQKITLANDYHIFSNNQRAYSDKKNTKHIDLFSQMLAEAESIPDSNGSEYFVKHDFRVGVIGDVYMYNFYKDIFTAVHYLSPDNFREVLEQGLDVIIYTTCWKGIENEEWRGVKFREKPKVALEAILACAKEKNIKTVFQSIEDPSNFDYFLPVAEKFEFVLTTDVDCVGRYKQALGHDRVFYGEYGVNPQLNNPIGCRRNIRNAAFFAGSYPKRYKERCDDMEIIFDSILESNADLFIADRNFDSNSADLVYPKRFQSNVLPPVRHETLQKLHKLFRYNLNFNSIKQSPTMCAMRVYELQAQGNGLISNYANSVFNNFPGIRIIPFKQDMSFDFGRSESWDEYKTNISNIREVLNDKTSYQVVSSLLRNIGLQINERKDIYIAVICTEKNPSVLRSFDAQTYPYKVLIEEADLHLWSDIKRKNNIGYFCWFSECNHYEMHYLNDLINGFKYTNCQYVTKNSYFDKDGNYVSGNQHEYTSFCSGKSLALFSARYLHPENFSKFNDVNGFELEDGYSIDPFEVNYVRYTRLRGVRKDNYRLSVIVPVYNNGRYLKGKCIPSLRRNKIWSDMEILLIDDGSTDQETLLTLEYLESVHSNVRVKYNHDGGSGSASRPRNQGIDLATSPLITFLDPDNEISSGAYDLLTDLYFEANRLSVDPVEFVSGYHVKVSEDVRIIGKHTSNRLSVVKDLKSNFFDKGRFPVVATQSAVISKIFLDKHGLRFVENSAGQDTLFGWELIANAKSGGFTGDAFIIYYADRSGSVTNEVDKRYFKKKLILENKQVNFLKNNNLFDIYLENHFDGFMKNWYLEKLSLTSSEDYNDSVAVLREIASLYGKDLDDYMQ